MVMVRVVGIRTTRDGGGRACGIVTGMGSTPQVALDELQRAAEDLGQQPAQEAEEAAKADREAAVKANREAVEKAEQERAKEALREARRREQALKAGVNPGPVKPSGRHSSARPRGGQPWAPGGGSVPRRPAPSGSVPRRAAPGSWGPPWEWRFEVVDVRLTAGPMERAGAAAGWPTGRWPGKVIPSRRVPPAAPGAAPMAVGGTTPGGP